MEPGPTPRTLWVLALVRYVARGLERARGLEEREGLKEREGLEQREGLEEREA